MVLIETKPLDQSSLVVEAKAVARNSASRLLANAPCTFRCRLVWPSSLAPAYWKYARLVGNRIVLFLGFRRGHPQHASGTPPSTPPRFSPKTPSPNPTRATRL